MTSSLLQAAAPPEEMLTLDEFLVQVQEKHEGIAASSKVIESTQFKQEETNQIYTPTLFANVTHLWDENPSTLQSSGADSMATDTATVGVKKNFSTGTSSTLSYNITRNELNGANPRMVPEPEFYSEKTALEVRHPLLRNAGGKEFAGAAEAARIRAESTYYSENYKTKMILMEAEMAYWRLSFARESVKIQQENLTRAKKLLSWSRGRVGRGLADQADLLQTEAMVKVRTLDLQAAKDDEKVAIRTFNTLRGREDERADEAITPYTTALTKSLTIPENPSLRDDVKAMELAAKAAQTAAELVEEKNRASLDVIGNYAINGRNTEAGKIPQKSVDVNNPTWSVGLAFSMPLDKGIIKNVSTGYRLEAEAAEQNVSRKKFEQQKEWQNLKQKLSEALVRLKLAEEIEATQKQKLAYERDRHERGRSTLYQVLMFEQEYAQSQLGKLARLNEVLAIQAQMKTFAASSKD
jgi:outer membrane protein TolC